MVSQAIAFNLFLAFFPTLLIAVGFATSRIGGRTSLLDLIQDLTEFLPPGSQGIVSEFLVKRGPEAWKVALIGWAGTLLAGSQVMRLLMEGIHRIYGDKEQPGFLHRQLRGLLLLVVTIAPLLAAAILGVLGRPLRHWLANEVGTHQRTEGWWAIFFPATAIVLAMLALTVIYRVARPGEDTLAKRFAGSDGGDVALVAGERDIRDLCAARAVQRGLRGIGGGDRIDDLDAAFRGNCFPGSGVERGACREPPGRGIRHARTDEQYDRAIGSRGVLFGA